MDYCLPMMRFFKGTQSKYFLISVPSASQLVVLKKDKPSVNNSPIPPTSRTSSISYRKDNRQKSSYESFSDASTNQSIDLKCLRRKRATVYNLNRNRVTVINSNSPDFHINSKKRVKITKTAFNKVRSMQVVHVSVDKVINFDENSEN